MNVKELIGKYEYMSHACFRRVDTLEVLKDLRQLDEPEKTLKLKDVIKRIKEFDDGTKFQWTYSILKELGSDFGSKMFHEAYQQGRFDEGIEAHYGRDKVEIPQFVADWIRYLKKTGDWDLFKAMDDLFEHTVTCEWLESKDNQEFFARAWIFGYKVEEEKRYWVKLKAVDQYLVSAKDEKFLGFLQSKLRSKFTRKELEDLGFGWVFDCEGIEIEEVE